MENHEVKIENCDVLGWRLLVITASVSLCGLITFILIKVIYKAEVSCFCKFQAIESHMAR